MKGSAPPDAQAVQFAGSQSGIQAALDYAGLMGQVYIGPGLITGITNLTMYGKCLLTGSGSLSTLLYRDPAATGIMLREKTAAEGNTQGAAGIIIEKLGFYANGSTGNGLSLGNQGGAAFTSIASLVDVLVRDFTTGTGINLNSNAIHCRNVWGIANSVGFYLAGGSSNYVGLWAEANTDVGIRLASPWNNLVGVHLEDNGVGPSSLLEVVTGNNTITGTSIQLGANGLTKLIREMANVNNMHYVGINVIAAGHTWTDTIYRESPASGTGALPVIQFYSDHSNSAPSIFYDRTTNKSVTVTVPDIAIGNNATVAGTTGVTGLITGAAGLTLSGGNMGLANAQSVTFKDTGGTARPAINTGGAANNLRLHALSAAGQIQFNNFADSFNTLTIDDNGTATTFRLVQRQFALTDAATIAV